MPPKKRKGKKAKSFFSGLSIFKTLAWAGVILLTALTLLLVLRLPVQPPIGPTPPATTKDATPKPHTGPQFKQPVTPNTISQRPPAAASPDSPQAVAVPTYETPPQDDFDAQVRLVDLAILHSLAGLGQSQNILRHKAVEARYHQGQEFFYQNLTVNLDQDVFPFLAALKQNLDQLLPDARLKTLHENPRDLEISILGSPTHHIFLPLQIMPEQTEPVESVPRLVIVIDDLGESTKTAIRLARLPFPVSFSVLPHNTKAVEVAGIARKNNLELLLHLPCEPEGYPHKANSGPGSLLVSMSAAKLEQTLVDNLRRLPDVDGVNNHMGSRLTRDTRAMTIVLAHLKGQGKFFLDSLTTPKSVVSEVSRQLGTRYYRRHIFLDNTAKEHAIILQLKKAETLAKRNGLAIAIGHPYPETLSALENWARTRDNSVVVCKIQDI